MTIVAAGMMAILVVLVIGSTDVWRVLDARSRAQTAADAAALAAAQEMAFPRAVTPALAAADYASRNGASLSSCSCAVGGMEASVEVAVPVGPLILFPDDLTVTTAAKAIIGDATG